MPKHFSENNNPPPPHMRNSKGAGVRLDPLPPGTKGQNNDKIKKKKNGSSSPRALRSFLRNFLSDDLGSFKTEVDLREHAKDSGTVIRDVTVQEVANMNPDLRSLSLTGCVEVSDVGIWALARTCTDIRELYVAGLPLVTHVGLRSLSLRCRGIEVLDLTGCERVDDMGLKVLAAGCWNLQTLKLRNCEKVTDVGLMEIARMCPHLREVDLTGCQRVCEYGDKSLVEFGRNCPQLVTLNLEGCRHVGDGGIRALARGCPRLQTLTLSGCDRLQSGAVRALARGCPLLKKLYLNGCKKIMNGDLWFLMQACKKIRQLELQGCVNLHANGMHALSEWGNKLTDLSLRGCLKIDGTACSALSEGCTSLLSLDLSNCPRVGQQAVTVLTDNCTRLVSLNLTRCPKIGETYLRQKANELPFVQLADTFRGFTGLPDALEKMKQAERFRIETAAALRIQSAWRACLARGGVAELRRLTKISWVVPRFQAIFRGYITRKHLKRQRELEAEEEATRFVQRIWRGSRARIVYHDMLVQRELWRFRNRQATKIQKVYRGHRGRLHIKKLRLEAMEVVLRNIRLERIKQVAAGRIQCWMRGIYGRAKFMRELEARKRAAAFEILKQKSSTKIQAQWRAKMAREEAEIRRERLRQLAREEQAARQIQRVYRGYVGRQEAKYARQAREYEKKIQAVLKIQRCWRGERGRHLFAILKSVALLRAHEKKNAETLQSWWRGIAGRRNFQKYKQFVMNKRLRLKAVSDFQRVYRGHKGREEAEVKRALRAIDHQTRPLFHKIEMLNTDRKMVIGDKNRMEGFLKTSEKTIAAIEEELNEVMQVKGAFYDSEKVTGTLQRFKTSYLQTALKATLENIKARSEVETRALTQVLRSLNELDKAIRIQERKLKPLLRNVEFDVRENRHKHLRRAVRDRQRGATMMQKLYRGHRVREAISRCGGVNYWIEAVDDDGLPYYFNTWTQERQEERPYEMVLFGDIGGKGSKAAGTASTKPSDGSTWIEVFDEESGAPYYVNSVTNEYQWTVPKGFEDADLLDRQTNWLEQDHMAMLTARGGQGLTRAAGPWREMIDEESEQPYYQNLQNGEFQWEKPMGFDLEWLVSQDMMEMSNRSEWGRKAGPFSELFDPLTNTTYYFNERRGDAVYDKPDGFDQRWLDQQDQGSLITNSQILREAMDWQEYADDATGAIYYYNKKSGETVWEPPRYFSHKWLLDADLVQLSARSQRRMDAGLWSEFKDEESGTLYYINNDTGERQDAKPDTFIQDFLDAQDPDKLEEESTPGRVGGPFTEMTHGATETTFYFHFKTKEALFIKPEDFEDQHRMGTLRSGGRVLARRTSGTGWTELMDTRTGNAYYHNRSTRSYTWDKPAEFDGAWLDTQDKKKLIKRSKKGDNIGDKGWNIMSDKETDTIYYYNEELDQVASSLSPRTAHGMQDPPSALGDQGRALEDGEIQLKDGGADGAKGISTNTGGNDAYAEEEEEGGDDDEAELLQNHAVGDDVPEYLRKKLAQISKEYEAYDGRAEHVVWMEDFIDKGEHLNASSVADQILQMQGEARTKRGVELDEDAPPPHKTEEELWQEQAYETMMAEENGEGQ